MTTTLAVRHSVSDFGTWQAAFQGHEKVRRSHGATGYRVLRDGNDLLVLIEFSDAAGADAFQADPSLKEAMHTAGVVGTPDISIRTEAGQEQY
jgi:hypothetical protein